MIESFCKSISTLIAAMDGVASSQQANGYFHHTYITCFNINVIFSNMEAEEAIFRDNYMHRMRKQTREKRKRSRRK
jgi:hypothetical protein